MNSYAFAVYPTLPATLWDKLASTNSATLLFVPRERLELSSDKATVSKTAVSTNSTTKAFFSTCQRTFNSYYGVNIRTIIRNSTLFQKKDSFRIILISTPGRIRTLNNGFGDRYDTFSPQTRI